jgi:hypothetical protein
MFLTAILLQAVSLSADLIRLKNGRILEGKIVEQTGSYIKAKLKVVEVKFVKDEVESVETADLPDDFFERSEKLTAEGYSVPGDSLFNNRINMRISYERSGRDKRTSNVIVKARTNIPDSSWIRVSLKLGDCVIESKIARVISGKFYADFGPFEKEFMPAIYTVAAEFSAVGGNRPETVFSDFKIGSDMEIKEVYGRARNEVENALSEIDSRFSELNRAYLANLKYYDKNKWNAWSDEWLSGLDKIDAGFRDSKEYYVVYLYPIVQNRMPACIKSLKDIYRIYDVQVKASIKADKKIADRAVYFAKCKAETDKFYKLFSSMIDDVTDNRVTKANVTDGIE